MVLHSGFYTAERLDNSINIWLAGANGVRLFFVISGFVMIMATDDALTAPRGWFAFAIKRIIRIVPMYWAATVFKLVTMLAAPSAVLHAQLNWHYVVKSMLFFPAFNVDGEIHPLLGVGWTLTFEMFFYALFTLALLFRVNPVRALAPILVALAILSLFRAPSWPVALLCWADPIVLDFLAGMMLARCCQRNRTLSPALATVVAVAGCAYLFLPLGALRPAYESMTGSLLTTAAATAVLAGAVSLEPRLGPRVPRVALFMGAASYALYLMHPLVAPIAPVLFRRLGLIWPHLSILLSVCLALVAGTLCHLLIEKPATRILTGLAKRHGLLSPGTALPVKANMAYGDLRRDTGERVP